MQFTSLLIKPKYFGLQEPKQSLDKGRPNGAAYLLFDLNYVLAANTQYNVRYYYSRTRNQWNTNSDCIVKTKF